MAKGDNPHYSGNPAAVCLLPTVAKPIHGKHAREYDEWMERVADEMQLSETAFVRPTGVANEFEIRWWTPTVEVDLCGHATIASSHAIYSLFGAANPCKPLRFLSLSGELQATMSPDKSTRADGAPNVIMLDFPNEAVREVGTCTCVDVCW